MLVLLAACAPASQQPEQLQQLPPQELEIITKEKALPDRPEHEPPLGMPDEELTITHQIKTLNNIFMPSEITVNKGDTVRLLLTALDNPHTFTLDSYGIDEELPVGEDVIIEFTADQEGVFIYESTTPSAKANNMKGKLTVK